MGNMICSSSESLCLSTGPLIGQRNLIHQNFTINELIWLPKLKSHAQLSHYQKKKIGEREKLCPFAPFPLLNLFRILMGRRVLTAFFNSLSRIQLFWDTMDYNPPGSSVHGISQARILTRGCHFLLQGIFPTQGSKPHEPSGVAVQSLSRA